MDAANEKKQAPPGLQGARERGDHPKSAEEMTQTERGRGE